MKDPEDSGSSWRLRLSFVPLRLPLPRLLDLEARSSSLPSLLLEKLDADRLLSLLLLLLLPLLPLLELLLEDEEEDIDVDLDGPRDDPDEVDEDELEDDDDDDAVRLLRCFFDR